MDGTRTYDFIADHVDGHVGHGREAAIVIACLQDVLTPTVAAFHAAYSSTQSRLTPLALTGSLHFLISLVTNCLR
jgi:hypothetical protein